MSLNKKEKIILSSLVIGALLCALWAWHSYMRINWDNHIVSSVPQIFSWKKKDNLYSHSLSEYQIALIPNVYKQSIEIIKKDEKYFLGNKERTPLTRIIQFDPAEPDADGDKNELYWIIFSNADESITIKIQANEYVLFMNGAFTCSFFDLIGNSTVAYRLDANLRLQASVNIAVYENPLQYFLCNSFYP